MQFLAFAAILSLTLADSTQQSSTSYTSDDTFRTDILNSTNFYRRAHNATVLTWNDTLADSAADYADDSCDFKHSDGPYGENLAAGYLNVTAAIEGWGNEGKNYDFAAGQFDTSTGHFTQLVWKSTTSVGCGRRNCNGKDGTPGWYLVCQYYPRGNILGNFTRNVQAATDSGSSSDPTNNGGGGGGGSSGPGLNNAASGISAGSTVLFTLVLMGIWSFLF